MENSGMHTNDKFNSFDSQGRVLVSQDRRSDDDDELMMTTKIDDDHDDDGDLENSSRFADKLGPSRKRSGHLSPSASVGGRQTSSNRRNPLSLRQSHRIHGRGDIFGGERVTDLDANVVEDWGSDLRRIWAVR